MNSEKHIQRITENELEMLRAITMSDMSRTRMRETLLTYSTFHNVSPAVRKGTVRRSKESGIKGNKFALFIQSKISSMTALLIIALLIGGGTSYAAESALPGQVLYSIKTNVNEPIESALAISSKSEAQLQAKLTHTRLTEAETLAANGTLTAKIASDLGNRVKAHYERAIAEIERMSTKERESDIYEASYLRAKLNSELSVSGAVLAQLDSGNSANDASILRADIQTLLDSDATSGGSLDARAEGEVDQESMKQFVSELEGKVRDIHAELEGVSSSLTSEIKLSLSTKLDSAKEHLSDAQSAYTTSDYAVVFRNGQTALQMLTQIEAYLDTRESGVLKGGGVSDLFISSEAETPDKESVTTSGSSTTTHESKNDTTLKEGTSTETRNETTVKGEVNFEASSTDSSGILHVPLNASSSLKTDTHISL